MASETNPIRHDDIAVQSIQGKDENRAAIPLKVLSPLALAAGNGVEAPSGAANVTLTTASAGVQTITPTAARDVTLPAESGNAGLEFTIVHTGQAFALTVKDDTPSTITTVDAQQWATVRCNGTAWQVVARGSLNPSEDTGAVAEARLIFSAQPSHQDTIGIGGDAYEFIDTGTGTQVADDANIAVVIGGSAAATLNNLIAAINGTADEEHATVTLADGTTPAVGIGSVAVVADAIGTDLRIRSATAAGNNPIPADPDIALAESITSATDIWRQGTVNLNSLSGYAAAPKREVKGSLAVTTAMLTSEPFTVVSCPFTPTGFIVQVRTSTGLCKYVTDLFTIANDTIQCNVDGATSVANTDTITFHVWE